MLPNTREDIRTPQAEAAIRKHRCQRSAGKETTAGDDEVAQKSD